MQFTVDGWDPDYGSSLQDVEELVEAVANLDTGIEQDRELWQPVAPRQPGLPGTVLFVDGVRRIEARLWLDPAGDGDAQPGLCASFAAGVVRSTASRASVEIAEVRRALLTTADGADDIVTPLGTWQLSVARPDPSRPVFDVLSVALQLRLAELEIACAAHARTALAEDADDLLVIDGPLHGRTKLPRALGMVKTHQTQYLPAPLHRLVGRLAAGERTPVFNLTTTWQRWSWYLRLPGASGSPWAGVVRVEASPELDAEQAIGLANASQAVLPRFASESFREPRAPQNLYPISGLERTLRHRLGDPQLLRRALLRGRQHPPSR